MVAQLWFLKMGNQNSSSKNKDPCPKNVKKSIGIISFEIANIMSKLVHLHKSICDKEISKLKNEIIKLDGVKKLVSFDESYLIELAYGEKLDDLGRIVEVVSRLGKKCSEPALLGFDYVYNDIISGKIDVKELGFLVKDMDGMIRKFERYVGMSVKLYNELEVLNELEVEMASRKVCLSHNVESRRVFEEKVVWQRQDVRHLKDVSLWNMGYDKVVELLARTVCTLYARICFVFGDGNGSGNDDEGLTRSCTMSVGGGSSGVLANSGQLQLVKPGNRFNLSPQVGLTQSGDLGNVEQLQIIRPGNRFNFSPQVSMQRREVEFVFPCAPSPGRIFTECLRFSGSSARVDDEDDGFSSIDQTVLKKGFSIHSGSLNRSRIDPKSRLATHATPSTVGGSALALHYANVIIIIEKLLQYPHLVGEEARDDLYQMLPYSLRKSLRINLKSYCKNIAIYDGAMAHDWKETLDRVLRWLAPLAHNMIRWQSERNVEQQQIVSRTNVLLLQTLYFADREKTEAAICELLVGLNYICRYEHQQNALLDCASSFDFGDWMEWQMQCQNSCLNS